MHSQFEVYYLKQLPNAIDLSRIALSWAQDAPQFAAPFGLRWTGLPRIKRHTPGLLWIGSVRLASSPFVKTDHASRLQWFLKHF